MLLLTIFGSIFSVFVASFFALWWARLSQRMENERELLLVISHPDDESMFFIPTCVAFKKKRLLCLSNGNYEGLGKVRENELHEVANLLGFSEVVLGDFEDGFNHHWDAVKVAEAVEREIKHMDTIIVTFDEYGVSRHPNHIATHDGVQKLIDRRPELTAFKLVSDRMSFLKYSGIVGAVWGLLTAGTHRNARVFVNPDLLLVYSAMATHKSQFVWYRRVFIFLARCASLNILNEIR